MTPQDQNKSLLEALETMTVAHYQLSANQAALMTIVARAIDLAGLTLKAGETTKQTYDRLRAAALEQSLLALGDTQPALAERLQALIDEVRDDERR